MVREDNANLFMISFTWKKALPFSMIVYELQYYDSNFVKLKNEQKTHTDSVNDFNDAPLANYSQYLNNSDVVSQEIQNYLSRRY